MKARETKLQESRHTGPASSERAEQPVSGWGGVVYPAPPGASVDQWHPTFWDALVGYSSYIDPDRLRGFDDDRSSEGDLDRLREGSPQPERRWSDDEDFSSEHGYEPGFEGRSEFEHGDFERWL